MGTRGPSPVASGRRFDESDPPPAASLPECPSPLSEPAAGSGVTGCLLDWNQPDGPLRRRADQIAAASASRVLRFPYLAAGDRLFPSFAKAFGGMVGASARS